MLSCCLWKSKSENRNETLVIHQDNTEHVAKLSRCMCVHEYQICTDIFKQVKNGKSMYVYRKHLSRIRHQWSNKSTSWQKLPIQRDCFTSWVNHMQLLYSFMHRKKGTEKLLLVGVWPRLQTVYVQIMSAYAMSTWSWEYLLNADVCVLPVQII